LSHRHFCDFAGHDWQCDGADSGPSAENSEPTRCICILHGTPMEDGDHSLCPVELLACPENREEQPQEMGNHESIDPSDDEDDSRSRMFEGQDGNSIVGFCLWCNRDFYVNDEVWEHNADSMAACPVFQKLKDEHCGPPVLSQMLKDAGLADHHDLE